MATLTIGDRKVTVDDSFLKLSPEDQQKTVNEIAASIGIQGEPQRNEPMTIMGSINAGMDRMVRSNSIPDKRVDGNSQKSVLPGVLGDIHNTSRAFQSGATQGMLANFGDEIYAGATAPFRAGYNMLTGEAEGFDLGRGYQEGIDSGGGYLKDTMALDPGAARAGGLTGGVVLGGTLNRGGATLIPTATSSLPRLAVTGAAEGALYGGAYGFGEGEGLEDRLARAGSSALQGAAAGALLTPVLGGLARPAVPKSAEILNRGFVRDNIDPATIPQHMDEMPGGVIADLGPNLQGQAAAIATQPGNSMRTVTDFMRNRAETARGRISGQIDQELGPARPIPSIDAAIAQQMDNLGPYYTRALAGATGPVNVTPIASSMAQASQVERGAAQEAARRVRAMLDDVGTGTLTQNPSVLFSVRKALDPMIALEQNSNAARILTQARREVDAELARVVPDLKRVDAAYAELANQRAALTRGTQVMDSGKEALAPQSWDEMMRANSRPQNSRLSEGARAEIERIIGTKGSDRVALSQIIKGEGSWNYERLASTFGRQRADSLFRILQNERTMAQTEAQAIAGARTSPLISAKEDLERQVRPTGIIEEASNLKFGTAAVKLADKMFAGLSQSARVRTVQEVADALISNGLSPQMAMNIAILRASNRPVTPAVLASFGASQSEGSLQ